MAKALKIASVVVAVAGLALITGGLAAGASLSFVMGASSGIAGLTVGGLFTASALLSTGAGLLSPRPKAPESSSANADRLTVSINTRAPRVTVVGTTATATDLRDQEWSDDQSILHRFIVTASHRLSAYREIWFDDKLAWTATGGVQAAYAGYLQVVPVLEGSAANAINIGPRMGSARRYTGCAYVYLRFKLTGNGKKAESPFASSVPSRVTIVADGAPFYDPRLDSTVAGGSGPMRSDDQSTWAWNPSACRNPALAMLFFLLGYRIQNPSTGAWKLAVGKGIPANRLDIPSFITAANLCDETVSRADGSAEPRYRCDGVWNENDDPGLVLDNLKATMNAVLDDVDGKIRVTVLHNDLAAPIGRLTAADVQGAFTWHQTPALSDCINVIRGGYTDATSVSLFQLVDFPEVSIPSPDGIDRSTTLNLPLVQSPSQAQRLVKQRLQRAQYAGTFSATFLSTAWKFQKGDVVAFTFFPLGWDGKLFRIVDTATQVDGAVPMMLREEHASIYAFDATEVGTVQGAAPTTYDPTLWPIVLGITDAGKTSTWSGITDDNGKKPADNATNSADPQSPFGGKKVIDALQIMEKVPLLADDVSGLQDARTRLDTAVSDLRRDTDAAGVAIGALDDAVVDGAAARRQLEHDVGRLSGASLQLLLIADGLTQKLRDAGIVVDPTTGEVRIYAVDQLDGQMRATSVRLDAQRALIESKASSTEVDEKILRAVLSPEQIAQLEPLIARMASVEIAQDGIRAELRTKAELVELSKALERLTTAEQTISATDALVKTKVAQTAFDDAMIRLGSAETALQSYGDVSRYAIELRQARADGRQGSAGLLAAVLAGNDASVRQITAQADLRQELTSSITGVGDRLTLEVRARTLLSAALGDLDARSVQDRQLLVKADAALAQDIDSLRSANDTQTGDIATLRKASVDAAGGITLLGATLRQQVRRAGEDGATMLAGVLAGDEASRRITIGLAEVQSQLTTTLVAGFSAAASERLALRAQIDAADARYTREVQATADRFKAVTQAVTALEAEYGRQSDDIVATKATIAELARTTSKADEATVELINGLKAVVNDPVSGLRKTRTELTTLTDAVATDKVASGRRLDALEASVSDPATGLDATRAAINDLVRVQADDHDAVAESIRQVSTTVGDHTSSITFLLRSLDGEEAVAQLSVTAGGEVTGFRINGKDSVFAVAADRFIVGNSQIFEIDTTTGQTVVNALKAGIVTAREIAAGAVQQTIFDITPADIVIQYG